MSTLELGLKTHDNYEKLFVYWWISNNNHFVSVMNIMLKVHIYRALTLWGWLTCHVCCAFGAGRNNKNGLLSWKCFQANKNKNKTNKQTNKQKKLWHPLSWKELGETWAWGNCQVIVIYNFKHVCGFHCKKKRRSRSSRRRTFPNSDFIFSFFFVILVPLC